MNKNLVCNFLFVVFLSFFLTATNALAVPISPLSFLVDGYNKAQDDDAEWLVDNVGNNGKLDVGDTLEGVFNINNFNDIVFGSVPLGYINEISGVFSATVINKVDTGNKDSQGNSLYNFVFGPTTADGVMIKVYEDADWENTFTTWGNAGSEAAAMGLVTDGNLLWAFGMGVDTDDEYWYAIDAIDDLTAAATNYSESESIATGFNVALSLLTNNTPFNFTGINTAFDQNPLGDGKVDIIGSGNLYGANNLVGDHIDATSNVRFAFNATAIPEPSTFLLFGCALLAAAGKARKIKK